MTIQFQPAALAGSIALALGFTSSVHAAEQKVAKAALDTIVVTATRSEEKIENVPARISIIEPQVLEQSPIASLPHLLNSDASINMVQSGGLGQQSSIFLRGTESDHTLVLRDGVRLNTATSSAASLAFIDTTDIKQIEILKGPASVLYGSDAIGGVIQMVSKIPEKSSTVVTGEIGENKTYKSLVGADLAEDGYYAQIRGQRLESEGTPVFESEKRNYSFDQKGYSAKFGIDKGNYAASIDYSTNEGLNELNEWGSLQKTDFENETINLKLKAKLNDNLELNTRLSQFKDQATYLINPSYLNSKSQEAELYGKWDFSSTQNILMGVTHRQLEANTSSINKEVDSTGYYVQHQLNTNSLHTQFGVRVEENDNFGSHTVAQGAIRYDISEITSIYTNIGSAFKAPTFNDMYGWGGNPDLRPEESLSYEVGINQDSGYGFSTDISFYHTEIDNLINFGADKMENIEKAKIDGTELNLNWNNDLFFINTGYSYVRAQDKDKKEDLSRRPRQKVTISTGINEAKYGLSTTLTAISSSDNTAYDDVRIPGHFNIDVHGYYNVNDAVKLFANIQNVGDSEYRTAYGSGSYYINGGRLASAGVTFKY